MGGGQRAADGFAQSRREGWQKVDKILKRIRRTLYLVSKRRM